MIVDSILVNGQSKATESDGLIQAVYLCSSFMVFKADESKTSAPSILCCHDLKFDKCGLKILFKKRGPVGIDCHS